MKFGTRIWWILAPVILVGCGHESIAGPSPQGIVLPFTTAGPSKLVTPVITWSLERTADHPGVAVKPDIPTESIVIWAGDWVTWVRPGEHVEVPAFGWYWVHGFANGWSEPFAFEIAINPDGSRTAPVTPNEPQWGPESCTPEFFFFIAGVNYTLPVYAKSQLRVRTMDKFHRQGYQVGQVETLQVGVLGVTTDIPDLEQEQVSVYTLTTPIASITLIGESGSVHGACVSGR
jgi:hypothetical protein